MVWSLVTGTHTYVAFTVHHDFVGSCFYYLYCTCHVIIPRTWHWLRERKWPDCSPNIDFLAKSTWPLLLPVTLEDSWSCTGYGLTESNFRNCNLWDIFWSQSNLQNDMFSIRNINLHSASEMTWHVTVCGSWFMQRWMKQLYVVATVCSLFGRCNVWISVDLLEKFRGFSESFRINAGIVLTVVLCVFIEAIYGHIYFIRWYITF